MGEAAGLAAAAHLRQVLREQPHARVIFAAAPSQGEMLKTLARAQDIDWSRVVAFHMDEYTGLPTDHPQRFGRWLDAQFWNKVNPGQVHYLEGDTPDLQGECDRYSALLTQAPIDLVLLGIGENGHIAFNDPPVADFNDSALVKLVELDEICRQQQVNDGCFPALDRVPTHALTLTCPALMAGRRMICTVPAPTKVRAVREMLRGPVSTACPASILRTHASAEMFLDPDSASLL